MLLRQHFFQIYAHKSMQRLLHTNIGFFTAFLTLFDCMCVCVCLFALLWKIYVILLLVFLFFPSFFSLCLHTALFCDFNLTTVVTSAASVSNFIAMLQCLPIICALIHILQKFVHFVQRFCAQLFAAGLICTPPYTI